MKIPTHIGMFALIVIVLWLTMAVAPTVADAPPSTPTAITLSLSTNAVTLGNNLTISGSITPSVSGFPPVSGVAVTLTYTKPDATTLNSTVTSGTDGSFNDIYMPDAAGSWSVVANWAGNVDYLGATTFAEAFTVTNSSGGSTSVYLYAGVVIIVVAIAAVATYLYRKKK